MTKLNVICTRRQMLEGTDDLSFARNWAEENAPGAHMMTDTVLESRDGLKDDEVRISATLTFDKPAMFWLYAVAATAWKFGAV